MNDPLTIKAFVAWLDESPQTRFDIGNATDCALTRYARSLGHEGSTVGFDIMASYGGHLTIPGLLEAMEVKHREAPETFGALARHLRSA